MCEAATKLKKAIDALRKASNMSPKLLAGVFMADEKDNLD